MVTPITTTTTPPPRSQEFNATQIHIPLTLHLWLKPASRLYWSQSQRRRPEGLGPIVARTSKITEAGEGETGYHKQALKTLPRSNTHYLSSFLPAKVTHSQASFRGGGLVHLLCTYLEGRKMGYLKTAHNFSTTALYSTTNCNLLNCFPTGEYSCRKQWVYIGF